MYAAQGGTFPAVIADMQKPPTESASRHWLACYVMLSRAKSLDGFLVLRPATREELSAKPPQYLLDELLRLEQAEAASLQELSDCLGGLDLDIPEEIRAVLDSEAAPLQLQELETLRAPARVEKNAPAWVPARRLRRKTSLAEAVCSNFVGASRKPCSVASSPVKRSRDNTHRGSPVAKRIHTGRRCGEAFAAGASDPEPLGGAADSSNDVGSVVGGHASVLTSHVPFSGGSRSASDFMASGPPAQVGHVGSPGKIARAEGSAAPSIHPSGDTGRLPEFFVPVLSNVEESKVAEEGAGALPLLAAGVGGLVVAGVAASSCGEASPRKKEEKHFEKKIALTTNARDALADLRASAAETRAHEAAKRDIGSVACMQRHGASDEEVFGAKRRRELRQTLERSRSLAPRVESDSAVETGPCTTAKAGQCARNAHVCNIDPEKGCPSCFRTCHENCTASLCAFTPCLPCQRMSVSTHAGSPLCIEIQQASGCHACGQCGCWTIPPYS